MITIECNENHIPPHAPLQHLRTLADDSWILNAKVQLCRKRCRRYMRYHIAQCNFTASGFSLLSRPQISPASSTRVMHRLRRAALKACDDSPISLSFSLSHFSYYFFFSNWKFIAPRGVEVQSQRDRKNLRKEWVIKPRIGYESLYRVSQVSTKWCRLL